VRPLAGNGAHWLDLEPATHPDDVADLLAPTYWSALRGSLHGTVRVDGPDLGPLRLRLAGRRGPVLLAFGVAEQSTTADGVLELAFPIHGGLTAGAAGGTLTLSLAADRAGVRVDGYTPRLAGGRAVLRPLAALYGSGQRRLHDRVTGAYLARLRQVLR
jgi:hypothetical protein